MSERALSDRWEPVSRDGGPVAMLLRPRAATRAHCEARRWWPSLVVFLLTGALMIIGPAVIAAGVPLSELFSDVSVPLVIAVCSGLTALGGLVASGLFLGLGRAMAGTASFRDVFVATGIAVSPWVVMQALGLVAVAMIGPTKDGSLPPAIVAFLALQGLVVFYVAWRLSVCLGAVHGFSAWRGFVMVVVLWMLGGMVLTGVRLASQVGAATG